MDLYQRYEALSPIYRGGLTNHLPMVYTILKKCGVSKEVITQRLDEYRDKNAITDLTDHTFPISDFEQEYINLTSKYLGELNHKGIDVVVGEFINRYKFHIEAALFHGIIRLAYAKQEGNILMIAQAMSYFELSISSIEVTHSGFLSRRDFSVKHQDFLTSFNEIGFTFTSMNTMGKFKELLELDMVKENLYKLNDISKEKVLEFILDKYIKTEDFFVLHLITGFEALLELEEYIFEFDEVCNHFFVVSQLFILFNTKEKEMFEATEKEIYELEEELLSLQDFHDIKLLFSLKKLNSLFDFEQIKYIANRIFKE